MEKVLIASGIVSAGAIAGTAYSVLDKSPFKEPASAQAPNPGPEISGQVTNAMPALLPAAAPETTKQVTLEIINSTLEIAAGVRYNAWTFGGSVPGPFLHVRQGDTINFTLKNSGNQGHSIDFHAAQTPWNINYKTILPGDSLSFTWKADVPVPAERRRGSRP